MFRILYFVGERKLNHRADEPAWTRLLQIAHDGNEARNGRYGQDRSGNLPEEAQAHLALDPAWSTRAPKNVP